jgi:transposase
MTNIEQNQPRVERVDDIPVIYGMMERMGIQAVIDEAVTPHANWQGLSPGWVTMLWLVHILSEQNHLMEPVQQWAARHLTILSKLSGQPICELDFTDDRLAMCLRDLSPKATWHAIEEQLGQRLIRVYDLKTGAIRLDATVGTVHHGLENSVLFQVGKAKNGNYETLFKTMLTSLDPFGLPLVVDVEPGNRADDPLYIPSYQRAKTILERDGLLVVGDSKMSALLTRATIAAGQDHYLVPLADRKDEPKLLSSLLGKWMDDNAVAEPIFLPEDRPADGSEPDPKLAVACGFEETRPRTAIVDGQEITWEERLLIVRSYSYMKSELAGLRRRLEKAEAALVALTPPRQRGKKQIRTEGELLSAIEKIEKRYRVKGFFHYDYQEEIEERGVRGYQSKPSRVERKVRYQLTVSRNQSAIEATEFSAGWRIYASNEAIARLSLADAVSTYREQIVAENIFRRLHGKMLSVTPLYVQREDHAQGLIHLLTLGARALALGDYLAKEALAKEGIELAGVYAGNAKRSTPRPTTERMLKAFEGIDLIIFPQAEQPLSILTRLSPVHEHILALLGLQTSLFTGLQSA